MDATLCASSQGYAMIFKLGSSTTVVHTEKTMKSQCHAMLSQCQTDTD